MFRTADVLLPQRADYGHSLAAVKRPGPVREVTKRRVDTDDAVHGRRALFEDDPSYLQHRITKAGMGTDEDGPQRHYWQWLPLVDECRTPNFTVTTVCGRVAIPENAPAG